MVKDLPASARDTGDVGSIPGSGKSPGGANSNPLQCSCLGNPIDGGAWQDDSPWGRKEPDTTWRLSTHTQSEENKGKGVRSSGESPCERWDAIKRNRQHIPGVPGEEGEAGRKAV